VHHPAIAAFANLQGLWSEAQEQKEILPFARTENLQRAVLDIGQSVPAQNNPERRNDRHLWNTQLPPEG
jgi:hypothetical protein